LNNKGLSHWHRLLPCSSLGVAGHRSVLPLPCLPIYPSKGRKVDNKFTCLGGEGVAVAERVTVAAVRNTQSLLDQQFQVFRMAMVTGKTRKRKISLTTSM